MGQITDGSYWFHTWSGVAGDSSTDSVGASRLSDKTVTVDGTFDGATVTIQGSIDGANWHTMTTVDGDATFTEAGMGLLVENPRYIRASVSDTGTPSLTVSIGASVLS